MTKEEQAEKRCSEYFQENCYKENRWADTHDLVTMYLDGYNKANEWHYVKDGLPKELHDVICFVIHNERRYVLQGYLRDGRWVLSPLGTYLNNEDVIAWKEIVLPEPSKYWDLSTGENNINKENE